MKIPVLDHGYVELIETWGIGKDGRDLRVEHDFDGGHAVDDCDFEVGIIEAARQSTQGSFRGWNDRLCNDEGCDASTQAHEHPGDNYLLSYLYRNNHMTPFEFSGMVIEVQAPIFVFREWHRHRTQSYNEMSARYAPLPDLYYVPSGINVIERFNAAKTSKNKQAGSAVEVSSFQAGSWLHELEEQYARCEELYQKALRTGVPKELARLIMPVGHYSRMRAAANLRNWLGFLTLRCASNAQWEIRQFANAVAQLIVAKFPRTYALWSAANGYDGSPAT